MKPFVHLHLHTEYSLLDGATRIEPLLDRCVELGMPAVAVTDHGNMYCAWHFYHAALAKGIKPILGCEFYICDDLTKKGGEYREYHHLILLAKNNVGYKNLVKLDSIAFVDGFYYKPRIDFATLKQHSEGLICLSACIAGELPSLVLDDRLNDARKLIDQYVEVFGDDYYIELQDHGIPEERLAMPLLLSLAREKGVKPVVTNDVHYLEQQDAEVQDIMLCIQTGSYFDETDRMRFHGDSFYLKTRDEMASLFPDAPDAVDNTLEIADKCNVTIGKEKLLPAYTPPDGYNSETYLKKLVEDGLVSHNVECTEEVRARLDYELNTVVTMGFVDYYLIVWDFIHYAKSHGIAVGPGRGSGAGSLIAYLIGITEIPPFRYNLYFERFLNPQRKTMPDFDVDFCSERRQEVIDYVYDKYGKDNVSQIVTFGTMAAKNAIRDVARVLRFSFSESGKLAGYIPTKGKHTIKQLLGLEPYKKDETPEISEELKEAYENPSTHRLVDLAMRIEGSPRQTGMHAAGVVICSDVISDHVPLQRNGEIITTQYNMKEVEEAGLLKMDFLGLTNLTDIQKAITYVKEDCGEEIDFSTNDYADPEVFKTMASGDTMCIFQLESGGMTDLMKKLQPTTLEDIIAGIAIYRPGPMQYLEKFLEGSKDKSKIVYDHPMLKHILEVTNGCVIYQEQVMKIVQDLAGFSMAMSDNVRYAMSKKKYAQMEDLRKYFIDGGTTERGETVDGCIKRGIPKETANKIYDELIAFSAYAFNKAHATCYAYVCYQTAYLKTYHPVEFLCAMLNNRITKSDEVKKYINYAMSQGYTVLSPDINKSRAEFRVENGQIRFGLGGIKAIGVGAIDEVVQIRNSSGGAFKSMEDLFEKCWAQLNKRLIENLIKAGAFDCFGRTRADMINTYADTLSQVVQSAKNRASGQMSLFDIMPELNTNFSGKTLNIPEFPKNILYGYEKEVLGFYFSGSPLDEYDEINKTFRFDFDTSMLPQDNADDEEDELDDEFAPKEEIRRAVCCGGLLRELRVMKSKEGKSMAFGRLEDKNGFVDVGIFEPTFSRCKELVAEDAFVVVKGFLSPNSSGTYRISVRDIINPKAEHSDARAVATTPVTLWLKMAVKDDEKYAKVVSVLSDYGGEIPVKLKIGEKAYSLPVTVRRCVGIENELKDLLGESNVLFFEK